MPDDSSRWFSNRACKYYPCHKGLKEINCLFCFCPLYWFPDCGGNYRLSKKGVKDCSRCLKPHRPEGYNEIISELGKRIKENKW